MKRTAKDCKYVLHRSVCKRFGDDTLKGTREVIARVDFQKGRYLSDFDEKEYGVCVHVCVSAHACMWGG